MYGVYVCGYVGWEGGSMVTGEEHRREARDGLVCTLYALWNCLARSVAIYMYSVYVRTRSRLRCFQARRSQAA